MYDRNALILAQQAFIAGANYNYDEMCARNRIAPRTTAMLDHTKTKLEAARRFPLPKITRPRVVCGPGDDAYAWRCVESKGAGLTFEFRSPGSGQWSSAQSVDRWLLTPETVKLWADLLANPTEEVEDDS